MVNDVRIVWGWGKNDSLKNTWVSWFKKGLSRCETQSLIYNLSLSKQGFQDYA